MRSPRLQLAALAITALALFVVFDLAGLDRAGAALFYDAGQGSFPLKDSWWLSVPGHTGLKWLMLCFWAGCLLWGGAPRRGALYMALITAAVLTFRHYSPYSCPWDLLEYGGSNPGAGRCVPAAHPLTGFALFGLYLALRDAKPRAARYAFGAACAIGLAAGAVQVARGAHFVSHVLWTAWAAWAIVVLISMAGSRHDGNLHPHDRSPERLDQPGAR